MRISRASRAALQFWATALPKWNRECPIVAGFTPVNSWEVLGRDDASTDWGCGGFIVLPRAVTPYLLYFTHEWSPEERCVAMRCERESTGLLELMGATRWLECFAPWCSRRRVQLEGDNPGLAGGVLPIALTPECRWGCVCSIVSPRAFVMLLASESTILRIACLIMISLGRNGMQARSSAGPCYGCSGRPLYRYSAGRRLGPRSTRTGVLMASGRRSYSYGRWRQGGRDHGDGSLAVCGVT